MSSNIDEYKEDLKALVRRGQNLLLSLRATYSPEDTKKQLKRTYGENADRILRELPSFHSDYQHWYSESKILIRQLLPDRLDDFCRYYEKPKSRKELTSENYCIEDCLQGLTLKCGSEEIVGPQAAVGRMHQQLEIVKSIEARFRSTLFDIRQLLQADLFDSELEAAAELHKKNFVRPAGVVAGVVLEKHLRQVADNRKIKISKKNPTIADYNDALKTAGVIETPQWRAIQRLGDLRNLCGHDRGREPSTEESNELVDGVGKLVKTLF